ncbi:hypothetical protein SAMN05216390_1362 [Lachnospiraceae bacterium KH1T2]|nr:hypothetical protein SAMN05216390_1362 [Lachnospiraceae bacterium KH1T2]
MSNSNTPYDDAFRTLLTDCSRLVIPLVNVLFDSNYSPDETVNLFQNEFYITEGDDAKRITDSNFSIGRYSKYRYHIECQSSPDGTIIVRVFEYATQIAISTAVSVGDNTDFNLPKSGILYLRSNGNTNEHTITVNAPNGKSLSYTVPIIKIKNYSLDKMLNEGLWFLIPFYFFNFNLNEMDASDDKIEDMKATYMDLWHKLDVIVESGRLTEFEKCAIKAMCDKVAEALTLTHSNVQKGVMEIMGGQVLDYEAKRIAMAAAEKATKRNNIEAVKNMISFGVPKDKILSKYPQDIYDEALKQIQHDSNELKEM